jgi:hypothetical protein
MRLAPGIRMLVPWQDRQWGGYESRLSSKEKRTTMVISKYMEIQVFTESSLGFKHSARWRNIYVPFAENKTESLLYNVHVFIQPRIPSCKKLGCLKHP